jgi:CTP synthase (UTP-ammonia lyase)
MTEIASRGNIGIIGEFNPANKTHRALNQSLEWLKETAEFEYRWIDTLSVHKEGERLLGQLTGIWSAPGSPFKSLEGALEAIRFAGENNIPHLGTCAGFQHAIIEFARNVLQIPGAQHEEYDSNSSKLFISRLACSLVGSSMTVHVKEGTKAYQCYGRSEATEDYYCNFGINPDFKAMLVHPALNISGVDQDGEIRIIEIPENNFFVATLFVPQSRGTREFPHPIISAFVRESTRRRREKTTSLS